MLKSQSALGRSVGIISHVAGLRERIERKIIVSKAGGISRIEIVEWYYDHRRNRRNRGIPPVSWRIMKKLEKLWKKVLTSGGWCDIITRLSTRRHHKRFERQAVKKRQKTFEKPLDKPNRMWYNKEVAERNGDWEKKIAHWKLNNNVLKDSENSFEF